MKTFKIDPETNDVVFDAQNKIVMVEGKEEEVQSVRLLLGTNASEWFLNKLHGLVYQYLQVKNPDPERIRSEILLALDQEPRIAEVDNLEVKFNGLNRELTISFKIKMVSGNTIEGEEVLSI
jgi:hypothetical protein